MINIIVLRNPFDVDKKEVIKAFYEPNKKISFYFKEEGNWNYSINGVIAVKESLVPRGAYIVVTPVVNGKALGFVASIGLSVLTGGIASGAIFGGMNAVWRTVTALAVGMIGNSIVSKFTAIKPDMTNMEQSTTYGWDGAKTLTGQGYVNAVTYGRMKSGGMLISRHVTSNGEKQYLNLLYSAGEGKLDAIDNITINGNPLENYKDVQVDIRYGTNNQEVIKNFNDNYADQPLNYELKSEWSTHQVQGNACQGIEITISLPQGLYYSNDKGGIDSTYVKLAAQYRNINSGTWHDFKGVGVIRDKQNRSIYRVYRVDDLEPAQYEVRVRCVEKEGNTIRYANRVYWSQLTQIVYDDFIHPNKALIGIKALATDQLSGSDPTVNWQQERKYVYVWNPYASKYEEQKANNPAWACYDMIHQCKLIDGQYIVKGQSKSRLNYDRFNAWATQCDKKEYEFNYIFDTAGQLWEQLKYPEAVGRGKVLMQGTKFTCVFDYPSIPTQLFTVANIKKDSFKEEFQDVKSRANVCEISFMNKDKDYERDVLPVYSDDYDKIETPNSPVQIELMGCTSLKQAYYHGKHFLRANKYEIRTCTFEAFQDAIACTIGDIILLQHNLTEWGHGGRIQQVIKSSKIVKLEASMDSNYQKEKEYSLLIRNNSTDELNKYSAIYVGSNCFSVADIDGIEKGCIYTIGTQTNQAKLFRVLAITKGMSETTRKITCMEYYKELYIDDDYDNIPVVDINIGERGVHVKKLRLNREVKTLKDGTVICDIIASWIMPRNKIAKNIFVYYKKIYENSWNLHAVLDGAAISCVIPSVANDESYQVKVVCTDDLGMSNKGVIEEIFVEGKKIAPNNVKGFKVVQDKYNSSILRLSWQPNLERDILGYKLFNGDNVEIVEYIASTSYTEFITKSGEYIYKIKAIDRSGNISQDFATIKINAVVRAEEINTPNAPTEGSVILQKNQVIAKWDLVNNTYVDYYEIRTDKNVGHEKNMLAKTTDLLAVVGITDRVGTIYVYAHNPLKEYGAPLTINYNIPKPKAPKIRIIERFNGFRALVSDVDINTIKIKFKIEGNNNIEYLETIDGIINYNNAPGVYNVSAVCCDILGDGEISETIMGTVKIAIPQETLDNIKVTSAMLDNEITDSLNDIKNGVQDAQEKVVSVVASLNGDGLEYSAIAQLKDGLALKVGKDDVVSAINMAPEGVKIDGKYLNITGDTVFDKSVDINGMLSAGSITADKLKVNTLGAISANLGEVRGGTIIGCEFHNEDNSAGIDADGNIYGATITGSQLKGNEINSSMIEGSTMKGGAIRGARIYGAYIEGAVIKEGEGGLDDFEQATITALHCTKITFPDWFVPGKSLVFLTEQSQVTSNKDGWLIAREQDKEILENKFGICKRKTKLSQRETVSKENADYIQKNYPQYLLTKLNESFAILKKDGEYYLYAHDAYSYSREDHSDNGGTRWYIGHNYYRGTIKVVNI